MKIWTEIVVDWMIHNHAIHEEEKELYVFALDSAVMLVLPLLLGGAIGFLLGSPKHGIILVVPFMILRKFSGGYHAKKLWSCTLLSSLLLFLCITLSMKVQFGQTVIISTVLAAISLGIFSPVDSENRLLDSEEKRIYKRIVICCLIFFGFINIVLFVLNSYTYMVTLSIGIQLSAALQIPYIVKRLQQKLKNTRNKKFAMLHIFKIHK